MIAAVLRSIFAAGAVWGAASGAAALECKHVRTRLDRFICATPDLRQQDSAVDKAFAETLKRSGAKAAELRDSQQTWLTDRDAACATSDPHALKRCLAAQYRFRLQVLAAAVPSAPAPAPAPAPSPVSTSPRPDTPLPLAKPADTLRPGPYVSEAVAFTLQPDGSFSLQEIGGSRRATGQFRYAGGTLTLSDGKGDVGGTVFPLNCRILHTANGFAVMLGQPKCKPFDGLSFRLAE